MKVAKIGKKVRKRKINNGREEGKYGREREKRERGYERKGIGVK